MSRFQYKTLNVDLQKETRSLLIELSKPNQKLCSKTIFELESILSWATSKIEISSILLTSNTPHFSLGWDPEEISCLDNNELAELLLRVQALTYGMLFLPQTVVVDLKNGVSGVASELVIGADIKIMATDGKVCFNHLKQGFTPSSGGIGFLPYFVPHGIYRNWILSGSPVEYSQLMSCGFVHQVYSDNTKKSTTQNILNGINMQAPMARMQAKRAMLEGVMAQLDKGIEIEKKISLASLISHDWKEFVLTKMENVKANFHSAQEAIHCIRQGQGGENN
ncbi:MAG: enoyl-CoA hydratase/isomerase family protein [Bacteriovoracaceae bacterium]|jgi:enoyl-CoA hydratase/carnithine racemase|nr:enoyl-CoA hydratase/isomerase family protein [Bacteriovoracaceae bacterium]